MNRFPLNLEEHIVASVWTNAEVVPEIKNSGRSSIKVQDVGWGIVLNTWGGGNSNWNNWSRKTKKAPHSYQTDKQQCSMHMVTQHHLAGCAEQIRVLRRPKGSYPKFSSELWIFFITTNFVVIGTFGLRPTSQEEMSYIALKVPL